MPQREILNCVADYCSEAYEDLCQIQSALWELDDEDLAWFEKEISSFVSALDRLRGKVIEKVNEKYEDEKW